MKSIYAKDIKAMKLTESEFYAIEDIVYEINKSGTSDNLNMYLEYGSDWKSKEAGIKKIIKYFTTIAIMTDKTNDFSIVCLNVATKLGTSRNNIAKYLKGMRDVFFIADQFGQNYIELN